MKTAQELYNEIISNEDLKKAFLEAQQSGKIAEFVKSLGLDAAEDEIQAFLSGISGEDKELSLDELDDVSGGGCGGGKKKKKDPDPEPAPEPEQSAAPECPANPIDGTHEWKTCGDLPGMMPYLKCVWCGTEKNL